jgi:hypothetical protein
MRVLTIAALIATSSSAFANYNDGGTIMLGNFSNESAYAHDTYHAPVRERYYDVEVPRPIPAVRPHTSTVAKNVPAKKPIQLAALEEPAPFVKPQVRLTPELPPEALEAEQRALANKSITAVGIARAYNARKKEGIKEWTCMHESGKLMLAHIEAQFGKMDITTDGTCAYRTIAGTGVMSQHAYGKAIDFHVNKAHPKKEVVAWLIAHKNEGWVNGIMTYRDMDHIHVDTGPYNFVALNH